MKEKDMKYQRNSYIFLWNLIAHKMGYCNRVTNALPIFFKAKQKMNVNISIGIGCQQNDRYSEKFQMLYEYVVIIN